MRRIALNENEVEMDGVAQRSGVGNKIVPQGATAQVQSDPNSNPKSNKRFEVIFKQMMAKIDELTAELAEKIKIQAAIATRDPNVQGDLQTAMQRYGQKLAQTQPTQQSQSRTIGVESALPHLQYTLKGVIRNLWERKTLEEDKSLGAYLSTKYEIDEQINSLPILAENMVSIDASAKELVGEFKEKLKAILLGYFGKIAAGTIGSLQAQPDTELSIKDKFDEAIKGYVETSKKLTKLFNELGDSETIKQIQDAKIKEKELHKEAEKILAEKKKLENSNQTNSQDYQNLLKQFEAAQTRISELYEQMKKIDVWNAAPTTPKNTPPVDVEKESKEWFDKAIPTMTLDRNLLLNCKNGKEALKKGESDEEAADTANRENTKDREEIAKLLSNNGRKMYYIEDKDVNRAVELMHKYDLKPCDTDDIKKMWPQYQSKTNNLCSVSQRKNLVQDDLSTENYSNYLAKKILEGSNLEAKKRYYKYLLENGM